MYWMQSETTVCIILMYTKCKLYIYFLVNQEFIGIFDRQVLKHLPFAFEGKCLL